MDSLWERAAGAGQGAPAERGRDGGAHGAPGAKTEHEKVPQQEWEEVLPATFRAPG